MADKTVTQLTELTSVDDADIMYIIDDPSGTPTSKKCTVANLLLGANTLDSATPGYSDLLGFVDDPAGTPAMASATIQEIVVGGASQGALANIVDSNLTVSRALVSDASGKITVADVTSTELSYLDGVTSAIQTQLDAKEDTINLTASRAVVSGSGGALEASAVTSTEVGYLDGVTSNIQTQLDAKEDTISLTASRAVVSGSGGALEASAVTSTELGYLDGVTSNLQTQCDSKVPMAGYTTANQATSADYYTKIADIDLTAQYQANAFTANVIGYNEGTTDQFEFAQLSVRVNQAAAMESEPDVNVEVCNNKILNSSNFHAVITTNSATHTIVEIYLKMTKDYQAYTVVPLTSAGTGTTTFYSSQSIDASLPSGTKEAGAMVIPPMFSRMMQQYIIDQLATIVTSSNIERLIFFDATGTATEITDRAGVDNADLGQAANNTDPGVSGCARTLRFDGSSTYFEFPDATDMTPTADGHLFSVVACVKPKEVNVEQQILAKADYTTSSEAREWEFYLDSTNHLSATFWDESADAYVTIASSDNVSYDLDNWNVYAFSYNGWAPESSGLVTWRNGAYANGAGYTTSGTFTSCEDLGAKVGNYRVSTAGAKEEISNMEYGVLLIVNEQLSEAQNLSISNLFRLYVGEDIAAV